MTRMPGIPPAANARAQAHAVARGAWRGLVQVLTGPEPPSVWRWRSPEERRAAYTALGVATLALCVADLADRVAGAAAGPAGTRRLAWRLAVGRGADTRAAGGVLPGRGPPAEAGTVVDVDAEPHPV